MLNTRIPIERLVDWIDQALLNLHLGKESGDREKLRTFGIRTATDLEDAFADPQDADVERLARLLNASADEPSRLRTILKTFRDEPNLFHIRAWKSFPSTLFTPGDAVVGGPRGIPVAKQHIIERQTAEPEGRPRESAIDPGRDTPTT